MVGIATFSSDFDYSYKVIFSGIDVWGKTLQQVADGLFSLCIAFMTDECFPFAKVLHLRNMRMTSSMWVTQTSSELASQLLLC